MKKPNLKLRLVVIALVGTIGVFPTGSGALDFGTFFDRVACYQLRVNDSDSAELGDLFLRLNVRRHSALTTHRERRQSDSPYQTAYSVVGKSVFSSDGDDVPFRMSSVFGSQIVAKEQGARLALTILNLLDETPTSNIQSYGFIECASDEASITPSSWACTEHVVFFSGSSTVTDSERVYDLVDPTEPGREPCGFFTAFPFEEDPM